MSNGPSNNAARERGHVIVSRPAFFSLCLGVVALVVLLLVCWSKLSEGDRGGSKLEEVVTAAEPTAVILVAENGKFTLLKEDGTEFESCGSFDPKNSTLIPEGCDFDGKIVARSTITVLRIKGSDCQAIFDGDSGYDVHINRPLRGRSPCHHTGPHG